MTGPEQPEPSPQAPESSEQSAQPTSGRPGANGQAHARSEDHPPPPVGSNAPNRWLTTDPPGDIDALRSTSSLGHRALPERSPFAGRVTLLVLAVLALAAVAVWQLGWLETILSPTPDVQAALNNAGLGVVVATVDGDTVTLTGTAESTGFIDQAAAVALSVDGIRQLDNQVSVLAIEGVPTLGDQIQAALATVGFGDLTVAIEGDRATVSGTVPDEESLSAAALAILGVPGVAQLDNRLEIGSVVASSDLETTLAAALTAEEFAYVRVEVQNSLAILQGSVPTVEARSQVIAAAREIEGINKIDNRLAVDADLPIGPTLPPEQLEAAAGAALAGAGIQTVATSVEGRRAVLDGTVPLENLGSGFFAFVELAETTVLSVDGIDEVSSRLTLRGDGAVLRGELQALLEATPVEFDLGSYELTAVSQAVLDQVALIIQSQPGLQVIIAGHTDTAGSNETNEALSRQRAGAVLGYLLTRGVPSYRLVAVSYGELFPDQEASAEQNRRIEFEVGP